MLEIALLGEITIRLHDMPITQFRSQKEIALLAYLAHTGQTHNRETLADLLWEARSTKQSLSNLRTTLARLRKQVGDHLIVTQKTVAVTRAVYEQTDSVRFQTMLAGVGQEGSVTAVTRLTQALALFNGELMAGFYLPDTPRFNDWLVVEQERLRQIAMRAYRQLAGRQEEQGAFADGVTTAQKWVSWDPLDETAQQQLMRLLTFKGQISEALAVYEKCKRLLKTELGISPSPATLALHNAIQAGILEPPIISPATLHNLPRALTPLYGRQKELASLNDLLLNPDYPLIAITGVGGMGKTSLALAAARQLIAGQNPFSDGIWFVSLEQIENDTLEVIKNRIAVLIGQVMGMYFHSETNLWSQLLGQLAGKNLLLILDNIEQFLTIATDLIVELLEASEKIQLLVTSRSRLALGNSKAFPLTGLELPTHVSADALQNASVRLFAERAAQTPSPFNLEKHLAEVVTICQFSQGLPLGIELAAASLGRLMIHEIMPTLTNNFQLVNTTRHDLTPRHRTLHAVFDYSWQLLNAREQLLLAQLSLFRGGFTRHAAEAVLKDAISDLYNLQFHALVSRDETGRFRLHPLIRQFVVEKRENISIPYSSFREWSDRYSRYYLQMMSQYTPLLRRGAPSQLLAKIQLEQSNVQAAWRHAVEQTAWRDIADSLEGIAAYYYHSNLYRDGVELITLALAAANMGDSPPELIAALLQAKASLLEPISQYEETLAAINDVFNQESIGRLTRIRTHLVWGLVLDGKGDYQASLEQYRTAAELLDGTDEWLLLARSKQGMGWALIQLGQIEAIDEPLQHALEFSQRADDKFGEMMTLTFLGVHTRRQNNLTLSEQYYQQALQLARSLGARLVEGKLLANLGVAASMRFALSQAQQYAEQALVIFEQLNVPRNREITGGDLGVVYAKLGNYERAQQLLEQSLVLARQIEDRYGEAWGLNWLSDVVLKRGDAAKALQLAKTAMDVAEEIGIEPLRIGGLVKMGDALLAQGAFTEAAGCYQEARIFFKETKQIAEETFVLVGLAEIELRQQQPIRAISFVDTILNIIAANPELEQSINLHIYWFCAQVLIALGDPRATAVLGAGYAILMSRADRIDDQAAREMFLENVPAHRAILALAV